jgi:hypothetical protein
MGSKINYKIWDGFLWIEVADTLELKDIKVLSDDVREIMASNELKKMLVDVRKIQGRLGIFESLQRIESFKPVAKKIQLAIFDLIENKYNNSFFENASYNRGFTINFFYNEIDARKWLKVEHLDKPEKIIVKEY